MTEHRGLNLHEDLPLFRESVNFTAAKTGFNSQLVEKDYFCTVLLAYLNRHGDSPLVFKGGTCLAKVHADFYRLSEDLDFTIPIAADAGRPQRRKAVDHVKKAVARVADSLPKFTCAAPLTGANNSSQYNGGVGYRSPTTGQEETILVEVSVREPLLMPAIAGPARTLLLDPVSGAPAVEAVTINCIALKEAVAEKFRAALSRKDVAIRDFYDLDYAVQRLGIDVNDARLVALVQIGRAHV